MASNRVCYFSRSGLTLSGMPSKCQSGKKPEKTKGAKWFPAPRQPKQRSNKFLILYRKLGDEYSKKVGVLTSLSPSIPLLHLGPNGEPFPSPNPKLKGCRLRLQ